ncbi:MAG: sodium-dependent transporter, partial [Calditrichaeota bacterium]|nr:sodium-dependent transporter [Calditrichota bacterium]
MLELFIRNLGDLNQSRHSAVIKTAVFCIIFGLPSAYSADIFDNQDWVWGIGLIFSGLFIIFAVMKYGLVKFKEEFIDQDSDFKIPTKYVAICLPFNIALGILLIIWWMSRDFTSGHAWFNESGAWNLFSAFSNATIVTQIGIVLMIGIVLNGFLYKKFIGDKK